MEFEIDGIKYRVAPINARKQFHIVRRLMSILSGLSEVSGEDVDAASALDKFGDALSKLSDEDADYCIFGLLSSISRKAEGGVGWTPICAEKTIMFEDINSDMVKMFTLAWNSLNHNILGKFKESGFLGDLTSDLAEASQVQKSQ